MALLSCRRQIPCPERFPPKARAYRFPPPPGGGHRQQRGFNRVEVLPVGVPELLNVGANQESVMAAAVATVPTRQKQKYPRFGIGGSGLCELEPS